MNRMRPVKSDSFCHLQCQWHVTRRLFKADRLAGVSDDIGAHMVSMGSYKSNCILDSLTSSLSGSWQMTVRRVAHEDDPFRW